MPPSETFLKRMNHLNSLLMVIAAVLAMYKPFEVFLLAFIILGPLHYLTEISWLEKKDFYSNSKTAAWLFLPLCLLLMLPEVIKHTGLSSITTLLMIIAFVYAFVLAGTTSVIKTVITLLATVVFLRFSGLDTYPLVTIGFVLLLPTIIHVWFFTGTFLVTGVLKQKNASGYLSVAIFIICSLLTLMMGPFQQEYVPSSFVSVNYKLHALNKILSDLFHIGNISNKESVLSDSTSYRIMSFITFSYLYHYLNWFSKTEIIGWHRISYSRLGSIAAAWIVLLVWYFIHPQSGFWVISSLSMLHVLMELPLNVKTLKGFFTA